MNPKNSAQPRGLSEVLWTFRREFLVVGVFSLVVNLLMLTPTIYMLQVFDRVMMSQSYMTLVVVSLLALFLFGAMAFAEWARSILLVRTGVKLDQALSQRVFKASFLSYLNPAETAPSKAFGDLTVLRQFMTGNGVFAFFDVPWIPIYLAVLFMLHPWLGAVASLFAVVQALIAWQGHAATQKAQLVTALAQADAQNFLQSKLRNVEVLSAMGMQGSLYQRWKAKQHKALVMSGTSQNKTGSVTAVSKFVRYAQQSMSLAVGAWLVTRGEISPGAMIAGNVLMTRALAPIDLLVGTWPQFLTSKDAYGRLQKLLGFQHAGREKTMIQAPLGNLKIEQLVVKVVGRDKPVLDGVSFMALPGTVTVVLGPSGCGKSTLARSMLGIWPGHEGRILLDEQPIGQWTRESLGQHVGYLPQDIELFDGTIAENIARIGEVDSDQVIEAAEAAGLHQMILRFPQGYDSRVGQGGSFLSGGQRQRIGLARALYGKPMLVVLDEPNANLDDEGEAALMKAVQLIKAQGKTVVLISHRPGVIQVADRLVILQDGKLVASGPRDGVLEALKKQKESAAAAALPAA
ncbi:type I secretion system permease/ATPase [Limnohabitans sp. Rim8]|uniref:type I secretion system permease/ATPase n=1 Tax=Limnohabitans sp. Rim8 TaxID=1100718 RepID=UPI0025F9E6B0|nr:type I secretion system permease/ATPase [Limnohabitans sp. Rim8]